MRIEAVPKAVWEWCSQAGVRIGGTCFASFTMFHQPIWTRTYSNKGNIRCEKLLASVLVGPKSPLPCLSATTFWQMMSSSCRSLGIGKCRSYFQLTSSSDGSSFRRYVLRPQVLTCFFAAFSCPQDMIASNSSQAARKNDHSPNAQPAIVYMS